VRLICATNIDLTAAISRGVFRKDLYYRINVISLQLPPLRERREDLEELVGFFVERYAKAFGRKVCDVSPAALQILASYSWPGNIRELENKIQRAIALATGPVLDAADFFDLDMLDPESFVQEHSKEVLKLEAVEEAYIRQVLLHLGHHQGDAARVLGIDRKTLYNKMVRYGLLAPKSEGGQGHGSGAA
jgi:two-component system, NtrC family, response regulator AtoC